MRILELLRQRFEASLVPLTPEAHLHSQRVALSRDPKLGDYQANIAMGLAGSLGQNPRAIAQQIVDRVQLDDLCEAIDIAGPGFINLRLSEQWLRQQLHRMACDERLGVSLAEQPRRFVIDFSSPNVAKPMHVGHIRSTVIGDSISRTLQFLGHTVITDNHLGDWGTQFGMVIYGYKHFRDDRLFEQNPIQELGRLYRVVQQLIGYQTAIGDVPRLRNDLAQKKSFLQKAQIEQQQSPLDKKLQKVVKVNEKAVEEVENELDSTLNRIEEVESNPKWKQASEDHPYLGQRVLQETAKLHEGDPENNRLWKSFLPGCLDEIHRVYERLDIHFDHEHGESFYHSMLPGVVDSLLQSSLAQESDGAICVFLEEFDSPMIIRKKDGAFLYSTSDIATAQYRQSEFSPDAILYVVDHRQSEHFQKLFRVLAKMGFQGIELHHIQFGTVLGPDGKPFKTRSGSVVGLDYLLDEAEQKAMEVVCNPERLQSSGIEMDEDEKRRISKVVGMGAIKYADLKHNRTSDYEFDLDKMVQFEGNTSAYIQYSYSRTQNILRKGDVQANIDWMRGIDFHVTQPIERDLAILLIRFEEVLFQSVEEYFPSVITAYLYDLSKTFASFYEQCPVLKEPNESIRNSRLAFVGIVGRTLQKGLNLLGIETVDRM